MVTYKRGFTYTPKHPPELRPPKLEGRVGNEVYPDKARSAMMPPPTEDTQEPRMSRRLGKGRR
jgi:hypothetical protein